MRKNNNIIALSNKDQQHFNVKPPLIDRFLSFIKKCVLCTMALCTLSVVMYILYIFLGGNTKAFLKEKELTTKEKMEIAKELIKERELAQHIAAAQAVGEQLGVARANDFEAKVNDAAKSRLDSAINFAKEQTCAINSNNCELNQSFEVDKNAPLPAPPLPIKNNFGMVKPSQFAPHSGNTAGLPVVNKSNDFKRNLPPPPVKTHIDIGGDKIAGKIKQYQKPIKNDSFDEVAMRSVLNNR
jgi:hypothetical protein